MENGWFGGSPISGNLHLMWFVQQDWHGQIQFRQHGKEGEVLIMLDWNDMVLVDTSDIDRLDKIGLNSIGWHWIGKMDGSIDR